MGPELREAAITASIETADHPLRIAPSGLLRVPFRGCCHYRGCQSSCKYGKRNTRHQK